MESEYFFILLSEGYLTTFAASPVIFENALDNELYGPESGREVHHQLLYKEYDYNDLSLEYPSYIKFPVEYRQIGGKRMRDMLDMRYNGSHFLISDRMKNVLMENGITGWQTYPIVLFDKKGNQVNGYHGFTVLGRGGGLKFLLPEKEVLHIQSAEQPKYIEWDISYWDGKDIFKLDGYIIITEKVKDLIKKNRIESPVFWPTEEHFHIINSKETN